MPDITMCNKENNRCKLRFDCYRYRAKPDKYWQSYASYYQAEKVCEDFMKQTKESK